MEAAAPAGRPDSPFDMHTHERDAESSPDAHQDRAAPAASSAEADTAASRPAPVQQAAQLLGRRLKVGICECCVSRSMLCRYLPART